MFAAVYNMHALNHDERLCIKDEGISIVYNDFPIFLSNIYIIILYPWTSDDKVNACIAVKMNYV